MPRGNGQGKHIGGTNTELHTEIEKSTLQKTANSTLIPKYWHAVAP